MQKIVHTWYKDPNVPYLSTGHLLLVLFSLTVMAVLCLPYTLFLLFSPIVEMHLWRNKCCKWVNRLKPIFDAYNGVYKDKYRFWTGVVLVARLPLIIATVVSENPSSDSEVRVLLSLLQMVIVLLLAFSLSVGGVYQRSIHNMLESWYLLNIAFVAAMSINRSQVAQVCQHYQLQSCVCYVFGNYHLQHLFEVHCKICHQCKEEGKC